MNCDIIRDLLSNYVEGLTSEETNEEIREHLEKCEDCRKFYEKMTADLSLESVPKRRQIPFLEKIKSKMRHRNMVVIISIICFGVFAWNYDIILPFDPSRMFVEVFQATKVDCKEDDRYTFWTDLDVVDFETSEAVASGEKDSKELVRISYQGIANVSENGIGRTVRRDGKDVRVVYYRYEKSLWDIIFCYEDPIYSGSSYGSDLYGDSFDKNVPYESKMIEIYYLPVHNLHKFEELTDEEFDAQKERATLVWSGLI